MNFRAVVELGGKTATGIEVPGDIVEALGSGKRPPVKVTLRGYSYQSTIAVMGGRYLIPLSAEHRSAAGVSAGDEVDVQIELDSGPREVAIPDDFGAALASEPELKARFDRLAFSHRKAHILSIEGAKSPETRQRRIEKALTALRME